MRKRDVILILLSVIVFIGIQTVIGIFSDNFGLKNILCKKGWH